MFYLKQKTEYEMRISDWSSDVCSSDLVYGWLDKELAGGGWATPYGFSLADCAAAPSLFYADWVHPIPEKHEKLRAYRARLLAHPSISRCVEEARPYRPYFPLGAPDRD